MISMEPVLKRGYASWDRDVLPEDEFALRTDAVRECLRVDGLRALVVVNHSLLGVMVDYSDMAYLSGMQSGGLLLVPLEGEPAYVGFGGGRELAFMRTLTWLDHVVSGGARAFDVLREQLGARGIDAGALAVTGATDLAPAAAERLERALRGFELRAYDARLAALRSVKRPREILATRLTLAIVEEAVAAGTAAFAAGGDNRAAMLEAERVARARKARDVRILASMGGPELRPWEGRLAGRHAPLRLWVAAQYQGYWAEASSSAPADDVAERAVAAMMRAARANATAGEVAAAGIAALPPAVVEPALAYGLGGAIGLAHCEGLAILPGSGERLVGGQLLALRAHIASAAPSIASAVVSVGATGAERLTPLRIHG
jgi:hypothetical protein